MKVLLICNYKLGVGGISGQVELLQKHLLEDGHSADIFSTKTSMLRHLLLPPKLCHKAKRHDLLHIHCCSSWGFLPAVIGITIGHWQKKRIILTYHGGGGEYFFDKHPCLVRHFLTRTDINIVLSGFLAETFKKHRLPFTIIPNIIESGGNQFRRRENLKPNYICTRAHEPLYNIPCILRAFQKVQSDLPDATLTLVGDGSQHEALISLAESLNLKNISFTGRVDNTEIYRQLDLADVLLSSPVVDNMPVSLLEAMNAGLLVIASRVGGVPYMIDDGLTGLLFNNDDSDQLAGLMIRAVTQQEQSLTIIEQAYKAVQAYHWENIKPLIYHAYGIHS